MVNTIERHVAAAANGASQRVVVIGFHQETAATYIQRIRAVLSYVRQYNQSRPAVSIVYPQLPLLPRQ